jgi:Mrp family chromosome partitioning ATPase
VDFLLFDAPPIHLQPEVRPLLWEVDQAVVVLEAGKTRKDDAKALLEALAIAHVEVLGCVLNRYRAELPTWISGTDAL